MQPNINIETNYFLALSCWLYEDLIEMNQTSISLNLHL